MAGAGADALGLIASAAGKIVGVGAEEIRVAGLTLDDCVARRAEERRAAATVSDDGKEAAVVGEPRASDARQETRARGKRDRANRKLVAFRRAARHACRGGKPQW